MRTTLITLAAGAAALAAGLILPAAAQAAAAQAAAVSAGVPAPAKSEFVAGYAQSCGGGPLYAEI